MSIRSIYWKLIGKHFFNKKKYIRDGFKNERMSNLFFLILATEMVNNFDLKTEHRDKIRSFCHKANNLTEITFCVSFNGEKREITGYEKMCGFTEYGNVVS